MTPLHVTSHTAVSALGSGLAAHVSALREGRTGLLRRDFETAALGSWLGVAEGLDAVTLPRGFGDFDCRNNRLAEAGLQADDFAGTVRRARERYDPRRIGVFLGTSTSGQLSTELAYRQRDQDGALPAWFNYGGTHDPYSLANYVKNRLDLGGPSFVVSTACSSGAKVYASAARMMRVGLIDAAVVGGTDSLCLSTLYGFHALELVSQDICRPWDADRAGLSLGEAAAFALLERDAQRPVARLMGYGETSDAHHMSSPHPDGAGAAAAMRAALSSAGLRPDAVDYLNLHGTATPSNDAAEDRAVLSVFGPRLPCSSTKGFTGHTLGAAGALEGTISMLAIAHGLIPAGLNCANPDPALSIRYVTEPQLDASVDVVASNSFGFGGSNACLVFGRC